ncbi:sugar phosphate nucleotidyltransferase [uncultured Muriicola sp.]|uniref:sugar phosphate nucleotidyltransferase n=1 Tax=uncultured Muriicola sp. TaxID=1583102 RepID=UPI002635B1A7|nr:sugar phosphate nucleotidyltransferase [uncultured Muriicola sp.]
MGYQSDLSSTTQIDGLAQSFIIGKSFLGNGSCALTLGGNIFLGHRLESDLNLIDCNKKGATDFAFHVNNPEKCDVVSFNKNGETIGLEEQPNNPRSQYAITELFFYDNQIVDFAYDLKPSKRGELEITDINKQYLDLGQLQVNIMGRG